MIIKARFIVNSSAYFNIFICSQTALRRQGGRLNLVKSLSIGNVLYVPTVTQHEHNSNGTYV